MTSPMHLVQVKGPAAAGPPTSVLRKHVAPQYIQVIIWPLFTVSCTLHQTKPCCMLQPANLGIICMQCSSCLHRRGELQYHMQQWLAMLCKLNALMI